jgi:hyperosmotically inducible protein
MNVRMKSKKGLRVLALPTMLLALSLPVFAADGAAQAGTGQNSITNQLVREVRHQLVMLPYYGVFDNLEFRIAGNNKVVLTGEVVRPILKDDAAAAVRSIPGVKKVVNDIKVLPLSPFDNSIRRAEYRDIYRTAGFEKYAIRAFPPIHIIVENGNVTLVGVVADKMDKDLAGIRANEPNVFHVTNDLRVSHNG